MTFLAQAQTSYQSTNNHQSESPVLPLDAFSGEMQSPILQPAAPLSPPPPPPPIQSQEIPTQGDPSQSGPIRRAIRLHKMNRNIFTVKVAWDEWKVGINGNPSIKSLISAHGASAWRNFPCTKEKNSEAQWFGRRKALIMAIEAKMPGMSETDAVAFFEGKRGDRSLDSLQKRLKRGETM